MEASNRQATQIKELKDQVSSLSATTMIASVQAAADVTSDQQTQRQHGQQSTGQRDSRPRYVTTQRPRQQATGYSQPRGYQPRFTRPTPQNLQRANYGYNQTTRRPAQQQTGQQQETQDGQPCGNCGYTHPPGACNAMGKQCGACGKPNHYARVYLLLN